MTLYEGLAATPSGTRALAAARLRYRVVGALYSALKSAGLNQSQVAKTLGVRRSAANQVFRSDGNLRINTVAEYLDAMGFELSLAVVPAGTAREQAQTWRTLKTETRQAPPWPRLEWLLAAGAVEGATCSRLTTRERITSADISYNRNDYAMSA